MPNPFKLIDSNNKQIINSREDTLFWILFGTIAGATIFAAYSLNEISKSLRDHRLFSGGSENK